MAAVRSALRSWGGNLLLLFVGVGLGLLAAEVLVRLVAPQRLTPAFMFPHGRIAFIHLPDTSFGLVVRRNLVAPLVFGTHVATNSLGLRDREFGPKRDGEFRILSSGDSYAFGFGVESEQTYGKVLESGRRTGPNGRTLARGGTRRVR